MNFRRAIRPDKYTPITHITKVTDPIGVPSLNSKSAIQFILRGDAKILSGIKLTTIRELVDSMGDQSDLPASR